jgi:hypothetical protein
MLLLADAMHQQTSINVAVVTPVSHNFSAHTVCPLFQTQVMQQPITWAACTPFRTEGTNHTTGTVRHPHTPQWCRATKLP